MKRKSSFPQKTYRKKFKKSPYSNSAIVRFASHNAALRRGVPTELKTLDIQFTGAYNATYTPDTQPAQVLNIDTGTATLQAINLSQQGTGISQRLGNKIALKSLRIRLRLMPVAAQYSGVQTFARVMILYDRNANGGYQATNAILGESLQSNSIGAGTFTSNLNPNLFERYTVLMDKFITIQPTTSGALSTLEGPTQEANFTINEYIKLKNLETQFNGTANPMTIAQIQTGSLLILSYGSSAAANAPEVWSGTIRLRFRDI